MNSVQSRDLASQRPLTSSIGSVRIWAAFRSFGLDLVFWAGEMLWDTRWMKDPAIHRSLLRHLLHLIDVGRLQIQGPQSQGAALHREFTFYRGRRQRQRHQETKRQRAETTGESEGERGSEQSRTATDLCTRMRKYTGAQMDSTCNKLESHIRSLHILKSPKHKKD